MRALVIERLSVRGLRNLAAVDLALSPRFNVLAGENGQGKTNLLEAVYALATSRSFRTARPRDLVAHGGELASVRALVREDEDRREQSIGFREGARLARIDGKRPRTLADYAVRTPVAVFHPGEISLSMGSGGERRRLLDRLALYLRPGALDALERYAKALRGRQKALEARGETGADLDAWEAIVVREGLLVRASRADAAARLAQAAERAFLRIGAEGSSLSVQYAPSSPEDEPAYRASLVAHRALDRRRGSARVGPHRDDLALRLRTSNGAHGEQPVRGVASQGQHRAVVLALKSGEVEVIAEASGAQPILLLDDVSSELDRARTASLFSFLAAQHGQVFITTTRRELIDLGELGPGNRRDFVVDGGAIAPV